MSFIEKVKIKLSINFFRITAIIKLVILSIFNKNRIYLFGIPIHGNLGDQAILLAEEKFLKENLKNIKVIEVESSLIIKYKKLLQKIVGDSMIIVHGGGFLGTLWLNEEEMFRTTLKTFPNNTIIVFPQTIYFSDDEEGKNVLKESKKIYYSHKHLYICCREEFSYKFMKEKLSACNTILIPDMVLYLDYIKANQSKKDVLFCIRQDKEKVKYDFDKLKEVLSKKQINKIEYTDTVINKNIYSLATRKKVLNQKLKQFSDYKLIVTDRLHGMVFALLAKTPCLVFENKSYKIKGVYEWIKNVEYIKLCNQEKMEEEVTKLLNIDCELENSEEIKKKFSPLIELINNNI